MIEQTCGNSLFDSKLIMMTGTSLDEESIIYPGNVANSNDKAMVDQVSVIIFKNGSSTKTKTISLLLVRIFECEMNGSFTASFVIMIQGHLLLAVSKFQMILSYFWFDLHFIDDCGH